MELNKAVIAPYVNVALRVPPLIVMESLCDGYLKDQILTSETLKANTQAVEAFYVVFLLVVGTSCIVLILLPSKQLVNFYILASLFGTLYASYICNLTLVQIHTHQGVSIQGALVLQSFWLFFNKWTSMEQQSSNLLTFLISQVFLAKAYSHLKDDLLKTEHCSSSLKSKPQPGCYKMYLLFIFPIVLVSFSTSEPALNLAPMVEIALALLDMKPIFEILKFKFLKFRLTLPLQVMILLRNEDLLDFTASQWVRIQLPTVFRTFCFLQSFATAALFWNSHDDGLYDANNMHVLMSEIMERNTGTYLSLICLASILSFVAHCFERFFARWLKTDREEDRQLAVSVPILFFILALQTGLPVLPNNRRLTRLYYIFSLVFLSSLRHIHSMLHYKLQTAALNSFSRNHIRLLVLSISYIFMISFFIVFQWQNNLFSTWLLSVVVFGSELVFKMFISLATYAFVFADCQTGFAGIKDEEYLYNLTFFGELVEFCFEIFVFGNGVWMLLFESAGLLRAAIMCAHLYFNIWCEAKQLYSTCMKRREASTKVRNLKTASPEEIESQSDVCSICYQDLDIGNVKKTMCEHLFHETCLCKWASLNNSCPLCHRNAFHDLLSS